MATSGVYGFYVTRDDIVREALLNLKKIDGIDPIEPTLMADCVRKLNLLVKQWQGRADFAPGLKVWTRKTGHLFLNTTPGAYMLSHTTTGWAYDPLQTTTTAPLAAAATGVQVSSITGMTIGDKVGVQLDTGALFWTTIASFGTLTINLSSGLPSSSATGNVVFTYTSTPQFPLVIESATLRDVNYADTPLNIMQRRDYDFLPNKADPTNVGDPTAILYETNLGYGNLVVDVGACTDTSKRIVLTFMESVQDIVNNTDVPYYPQEWYRPLCWALAKECAPMLNAKWGPECESNYTDSLGIAKHKDPEVETRYFQCGE
jgi:hypothetical protein